MSNYELQKLMRETDATAWPEIGGARIAVELAARELQKLNPQSDRDPCVFRKGCTTRCHFGSLGCRKEHVR